MQACAAWQKGGLRVENTCGKHCLLAMTSLKSLSRTAQILQLRKASNGPVSIDTRLLLLNGLIRQSDVIFRNRLASSCRAHEVIKFGFLDTLAERVSVGKAVED